jgi:hypothetical protein
LLDSPPQSVEIIKPNVSRVGNRNRRTRRNPSR